MIFFLIVLTVSVTLIVSSAYFFYRFQGKAVYLLLLLAVPVAISPERALDIFNLLIPVFVGAIAGSVISQGKSFQFYLVTASVITATIMSVTFYYYMLVQNVDILEVSKAAFLEGLSDKEVPPDVREIIKSDIDGWVDAIRTAVPFLSFLFAAIIASTGWIFIRLVFERIKSGLKMDGLENFRINDYFIIALISGLAVFLFFDKSRNYALYSTGINLMLIAGLIYVIQGLGVIKYFLLKKGIPGQVIPLGIGVIFVIGAGAAVFSYIVIGGLGALDLWADFRKFDKNNLTDRGEK